MISRRKLITNLGMSLIAAPAIVHYSSIMRVKSLDLFEPANIEAARSYFLNRYPGAARIGITYMDPRSYVSDGFNALPGNTWEAR